MKNIRALYIAIGLIALIGIWFLVSYNGLVSAKEGVDASWAQVETQYQRRADLVPNLVNTVKGAANFEQKTYTDVTEARTKWLGAVASKDRGTEIAAAQTFDGALSRLLVSVENYPKLEATQAFQDLMTQLEGTENRITVARHDFNVNVQSYNVMVKRFPRNLLAGMFGFAPEKFFENEAGAEKAPSVQF